MSSEDISNYASAVQSIFVSLAVLIGGVWAIYKFFSLKEVSRARAELRKREIETRQSALINIAIDVKIGSRLPDATYYALVEVSLHNPSSTVELLKWSDDSVSLNSVSVDSKGALHVTESMPMLVGARIRGELISSMVAPNETACYCFAAVIPAGLYLFEFGCEIINALDEVKEAHNKADIELGLIMWSGDKFFEVPSDET